MPETDDPLFINCVLAIDVLAPLAALLPQSRVIQTSFADLTADLLTRHTPNRVVLPLLSGDHDAIQVIEMLESLGYAGSIVVIGPDLPKPHLVEQELRRLGPGPRLVLLTPPAP